MPPAQFPVEGAQNDSIQEQLKVFSKYLFINPAGGTMPSGTHVQWKIYCLGSILNSKSIFTLLKFYAQNYKDINVCIRHSRETLTKLENEIQKWDPAEVSFHLTWLNNALPMMFRNAGKPLRVSARNSLRSHQDFGQEKKRDCPVPTDAKRLAGSTFKLGLWDLTRQKASGDKGTTAWAQGQPITGCWNPCKTGPPTRISFSQVTVFFSNKYNTCSMPKIYPVPNN